MQETPWQQVLKPDKLPYCSVLEPDLMVSCLRYYCSPTFVSPVMLCLPNPDGLVVKSSTSNPASIS